MYHPVDRRCRGHVVVEDLIPLREDQVRGDHSSERGGSGTNDACAPQRRDAVARGVPAHAPFWQGGDGRRDGAVRDGFGGESSKLARAVQAWEELSCSYTMW